MYEHGIEFLFFHIEYLFEYNQSCDSSYHCAATSQSHMGHYLAEDHSLSSPGLEHSPLAGKGWICTLSETVNMLES